MDHPAVGRLRGRGAPDAAWLDRLREIVPTAKVHWFPQYGDGPGRWVIAEHRPGKELYRATGAAELQRLEEGCQAQQRPVPLGQAYGFELVKDGGQVVTVVTDEVMGTDMLLDDLRQSEAKLASMDAAFRAAEKKAEAKRVMLAMRNDPKFEAAVDAWLDSDPVMRAQYEEYAAIADESWAFYMRGRRSVTARAA